MPFGSAKPINPNREQLTQPLKYTVKVTDAVGKTATASIVIENVFSSHQAFYSPGDPAERAQWIETLEKANDALAGQCGEGTALQNGQSGALAQLRADLSRLGGGVG